MKQKIDIDKFNQEYKKVRLIIKITLCNMITKCEHDIHPEYVTHGRVGIQVCSLWRNNPEAFIGWCLEQGYDSDLNIYRLNAHKDYTPENCILMHPDDHQQIYDDNESKEGSL